MSQDVKKGGEQKQAFAFCFIACRRQCEALQFVGGHVGAFFCPADWLDGSAASHPRRTTTTEARYSPRENAPSRRHDRGGRASNRLTEKKGKNSV